MKRYVEELERRRLLAGGPAVTGFKITPRNPTADTGSLVFSVTYFDVNGVDPTSFDVRDVRIAGPNGFARYARATHSTSDIEGMTRVVRYKIAPPGGTWNAPDNGTYTVRLQGGQVFDLQGNSNDPVALGRFIVNIPTRRAVALARAKSTPVFADVARDEVEDPASYHAS
jgi:hypothetical protein